MKLSAKILLLIFVALIVIRGVFASNLEGTGTYNDYLFILVHGIRSDSGIFTGQKEFGDLNKYLEDNLNLKDRVFTYTFKDINGRNEIAAQEFGDRKNHNGMYVNCWLDEARIDYKKWYAKNHKEYNNDESQWIHVPDSLVPSKYIVLSHSMGNLAVRSYIYSEKVFGQGKGFYNNDVAKVVFVAPPFLGSDNVPAMMAFWGRAGLTGYSEIKQLIDDQIAYAGLKLKKNDGDAGQFRWNDYQQKLNWNATWEKLKSIDGGQDVKI